MPTNKQLTDLVINKVESQQVFDYMKANNLINDEEIYLVGGEAENAAVLYTPQELTEEQKIQVLANINAASKTEIDDLKSALEIDYDNLLAFNTSEIIIGIVNTSSVLGQAILGQMILA